MDARQTTLELLHSPLFLELRSKKLIPDTWIERESEDSLVLGHEKADFIIYSSEWSFSMLKKAVLTLIEIGRICDKHGWFLQDGHLWNMVFFGSRPVHVDFGSFRKGKAKLDWPFYKELIFNGLLPLLIWSKGDFYLANRILSDSFPRRIQPFPDINTAPFYFKNLKMFRKPRDLEYWLKVLCNLCMLPFAPLQKRQFNTQRYLTLQYPSLNEIEAQVDGLNLPKHTTEWGIYHKTHYEDKAAKGRFKRIIELLKTIEWSTAVDMAGNGGFFTTLMLEAFPQNRALCLDYDSQAIERAFTRSLDYATDLVVADRLSCGMVNICYPTVGPIPLERRISADLVIALAVTHHLFLRQSIDADEFFAFLHRVSKRFLAIEFMPLGLWFEGKAPPLPDWYSEQWFVTHLAKKFSVITREQLEANRVFFLCKVL